VPMVPIVLRNVGEVMWRGAQLLSPGTIEVAVLPAVDTRAWSTETIDDHVAEVREMFLDTLGAWPGEGGDGRGRQPSRRRPAGGRKPAAAARTRAKSKQSSARAGAARSESSRAGARRQAAQRTGRGS